MKCVSSPALDDAQLVSYVDGEADDAVRAHITSCPYCNEKANRWDRLQRRRRAQLHRRTCVSPMDLGEYHLGLLPPLQVRDVRDHLSECPLCSEELAQLENFLRVPAQQTVQTEPKRKLIARRADMGGKAPGPGGISLATAFAGLRGEEEGTLILEADGIVVILDIQPAVDAEGYVNILGQIAAEDQDRWTGASVALRQAGKMQAKAIADDLGAFRFEAIPPGPTEFEITSSSGDTVLVPDIEIVV